MTRTITDLAIVAGALLGLAYLLLSPLDAAQPKSATASAVACGAVSAPVKAR